MSMRSIIVDDEPKSRNLLAKLIRSEFSDVAVVGLAPGAREGIRLIRDLHPDVVFLDINMPKMNGFDLLQQLQPVSFDTVFVTAYDQFAIKAFRYHAFDYLLKPVDADELARCIDRLREKKQQADFHQRLQSLISQMARPARIPDRLTIHSMDGITVIPVADIIYLEAAGAYTIFYWKDEEKIVSSVHLKEYEELLTERGFFRTHHSFLINLAHVKKFLREGGGCILMSNGARTLLSKRRRDEFMKLLDKR